MIGTSAVFAMMYLLIGVQKIQDKKFISAQAVIVFAKNMASLKIVNSDLLLSKGVEGRGFSYEQGSWEYECLS